MHVDGITFVPCNICRLDFTKGNMCTDNPDNIISIDFMQLLSATIVIKDIKRLNCGETLIPFIYFLLNKEIPNQMKRYMDCPVRLND